MDYVLWEHESGVECRWTVTEYPSQIAYTVYGLKRIIQGSSGPAIFGVKSTALCLERRILLLFSYALLSMWECEIASKNTKYACAKLATVHSPFNALVLSRFIWCKYLLCFQNNHILNVYGGSHLSYNDYRVTVPAEITDTVLVKVFLFFVIPFKIMTRGYNCTAYNLCHYRSKPLIYEYFLSHSHETLIMILDNKIFVAKPIPSPWLHVRYFENQKIKTTACSFLPCI